MRRSWGQAIASILSFVVALLLTCAIVGRVLGPPRESLTAEKLAAWRPHRDEFDVLFVGTSVLYNQLDPRAFDERMAEQGVPTRSFNLGVEAMSGPEMLQTLEQILAARPARLRAIVFSAFADLRIAESNLATDRVTAWHTARGTWQALRLTLDADRSLHSKRVHATGHVRAFLNRTGNAGRWQRPLARALTRTEGVRQRRAARREQVRQVKLGAAGYMPLEQRASFSDAEERAAIASLQAGRFTDLFEERRQRTRRAARNPPPPTAAERRLLLALRDRCQQAGVTPVFLIGPCLIPEQLTLRTAHEQGLVDCLLDFEDPDGRPWYYDPTRRFDVSHLDEAAAHQFSRDVADEFRRVVLKRDAP